MTRSTATPLSGGSRRFPAGRRFTRKEASPSRRLRRVGAAPCRLGACMTARDDDTDNVGHGRPPKSGQFRKGQSGNPTGRPRKLVAQPAVAPARFPMREGLRAESGRMITVTDAAGRHEVAAGQAVLRAVFVKAMQGGVLAQRTVLNYVLAEDERHHRECKENFDFWRDYQERCNAATIAAVKAGREVPDFLPHPDDIVLDWVSLDVRFLGAIDKEGRAAEK